MFEKKKKSKPVFAKQFPSQIFYIADLENSSQCTANQQPAR